MATFFEPKVTGGKGVTIDFALDTKQKISGMKGNIETMDTARPDEKLKKAAVCMDVLESEIDASLAKSYESNNRPR